MLWVPLVTIKWKRVRPPDGQQGQTLSTELAVEKSGPFTGRAPGRENGELLLKTQTPDGFQSRFLEAEVEG